MKDLTPFVNMTPFFNAPEVVFNLRYPGQYFDKESGLFYNYFRSYDAKTGRYTQGDPIGLGGGWNRFGYVAGNPLQFIDSMRLDDSMVLPATGAGMAGSGISLAPWVAPVAWAAAVGAGSYWLTETYVNPWLQPRLADKINACVSFTQPVTGTGRWSCTASCNVTVINSALDGLLPARVTGTARGNTEPDACVEAKRAATQSAPWGTYARNRQCSCSKS